MKKRLDCLLHWHTIQHWLFIQYLRWLEPSSTNPPLEQHNMLDHMTFRVTDIGRTKSFYSAALAPLGYSVSFEGNFGMNVLGFAYPDASEPDGKKADVWFLDGPSPYGGPPATAGCHLCWRAETRAQVDAFYQAAITAGGKDNGAPGLRPDYHPPLLRRLRH